MSQLFEQQYLTSCSRNQEDGKDPFSLWIPSPFPVGFQLPGLETEAAVGLDVICVPRAVKQQHQPCCFLFCFGSLGKKLKKIFKEANGSTDTGREQVEILW